MTEEANATPTNELEATPDVQDTPAAEDTAPAEAPVVEVEAPVETPAEPTPKPAPRSTTPPDGLWWRGTGRRKTAVARVRIRPGTGKIMVNKRPYDEFFPGERDRNDLLNVLEKTRTKGTLDVFINVNGGGTTGQAGAIVLGIARALFRYDESLESILRGNNFLTRDPRKVERKKPGQPGARKRFQFSKR